MKNFFVAIWCVLLSCTVSTQGGQIWPEKTMIGQPYTTVCIADFSADIAGDNPFLAQQARQIWLERLAMQSGSCKKQDTHTSVAITNIGVNIAADAFGYPAIVTAQAPEPTPPVARYKITTRANVKFTDCHTGANQNHNIDHSAWIAYVADPYLKEEQAAAILPSLVDRSMLTLQAYLRQSGCVPQKTVP